MTKLAYTYAEAAEATGLSIRTLSRHISSGDLTVVRAGAKALIKASELERFIDALPEKE